MSEYKYAKVNLYGNWSYFEDYECYNIGFIYQQYYTILSWNANGLTVPIVGRKLDFFVRSHQAKPNHIPNGYNDYWDLYGWTVKTKRTEIDGFWMGYLGYGKLTDGFYIPETIGNGLIEIPKKYDKHYTSGQVDLRVYNGKNYEESAANFKISLSAVFPTQDPNMNYWCHWDSLMSWYYPESNLPTFEYPQNNIVNIQEPNKYQIQGQPGGYYVLDKFSGSWKFTSYLLVHYIEGETNEPNNSEKISFLEDNWPYCMVTVQPDWLACNQTVILSSRGEYNHVIDKQLITFTWVGGDKFISDYFYTVGNPKNKGKLYDSFGNKYICLYIMPDSYIMPSFYTLPSPDYGDFNLDGWVNFDDFVLFSKVYGKIYTDSKFDSIYDYDDNGKIDQKDLYYFFSHWLNYNSPEDFTLDRKVNLVDYARISSKYMATCKFYREIYDLKTVDGVINKKDIKQLFGDYLKGR
jgi:hypothetical protein